MGYFDGVGEYSYPTIIARARDSGMLGNDPQLRDTSDLRDVPQPYHGTGNAVDFGNDQTDLDVMDNFARWLDAHWGPFSLEIIHTFQGDAGGVYWKFGQRVDGPSFYGDATVEAHRNHVHWAITNNGLAAGSINAGVDIMQQMRTINLNGALNMQDPIVRTAQALLMARGGMIKPDNTDHAVFKTVTSWFHQQTGLPDEGYFGQLTWQRVIQPLNGK